MLKNTFEALLKNYTEEEAIIKEFWLELEKNYSNKKRHYHTLAHLDHLLSQLTYVKAEIQNWDVVLFTLYYHDIVYNSLKGNNEEKSAELAEKRLSRTSLQTEDIQLCKAQILATKSHQYAQDEDTNYFTDADLSILGQEWEAYSAYYKNVRKEYAIYPNFLYNKGRKKALIHFLQMDRLFKTDFFYEQYEKQARENLQREIELL